MHVRRSAIHVEILTPAKINLFLEVLARRPDGYHDIETLIVAVTAYDRLIFAPDNADRISLEVRWGLGLSAREARGEISSVPARELLSGEIPPGPENLVWRAAELVRQRAGIRRGATIRLVKRIPAAAGLGGASSDAAATLVAANTAWQLGWPRRRLLELAAELGSDVPFFLTRGGAVCRGRGERMESIRIPRLHIVVVRPPVGLSTPQVYKACRPTAKRVGVASLTEALARGDASSAGRHLANGLQSAAASLTPWITTLKTEFQNEGVLGHQMTGSGSSYFGLCRAARHARRIAARLRARNIGEVFAAVSAISNEGELRTEGTSG